MLLLLTSVMLAQNPPDMLAMHCGPATDWVISTAEGPVDPSDIKKAGDYFFGTLRGTSGGSNTLILSPSTGSYGATTGYFKAPYPLSGLITGLYLAAASPAIYANGSALLTINAGTGNSDSQFGFTALTGYTSSYNDAPAFSATGRGWYESSGATAAQISGMTFTAGAGALIYDDTNTCWRSALNGVARGCIQDNTVTDGGWGPTNNTVFRLASVTTAAGAVDSTMNTILVGQKTAVTVTQLTGLVATPGTGAGRTIQFECTGIISGKRCLADISCANNTAGFDGGAAFTVNFFGYGGASNCSFNNDIVRCLGRNTPVDAGTDCTLDPVMTVNSLAIEGTYP